MTPLSNRIVYALFVGFGLFLLCGAALLWVDNRRIEHHTDELNDLRAHLDGRDQDVEKLRKQLRTCCPDSNLAEKAPARSALLRPAISDGWRH